MASLHSHSKKEEFDFLIKMKQEEKDQYESIRKNIEYIMKIPHFKFKLQSFRQIPQP